jgi:hypothetical protein
LRETLERGALDADLQRELGFTDDELEEFLGRLEEQLAETGNDDSPEAQYRRRQLESLLEGIDDSNPGELRDGGEGPREAAAGVGAAQRPTPPEYRAAESEYRKRLSGRKPAR